MSYGYRRAPRGNHVRLSEDNGTGDLKVIKSATPAILRTARYKLT